MTKSKESVERKIANNKDNQKAVAQNIELRFKKSAHTKESAILSGLGSRLESIEQNKEQSLK
ncbi:MAG: hypothetical protein GX370_03555 [Clostridia bacterium]|jgi:hypothetical protein|nr:hypothetical protein [Clostridia bacterium]